MIYSNNKNKQTVLQEIKIISASGIVYDKLNNF